ncbi:MAG: hypothetical protein HYW97_01425 [Candidatus Wildermuthbacteria bacterium]|nr:hypothetical protein [Candidatus Wildermuthbacteria bacterium]
MKSTGLFLKEEDVPVGVVVAICLEGKDVPEVDGQGEPFILQVLIGGVPARALFFPIDGGLVFHKPGPDPMRRGKDLPPAITGTAMEGFRPDIRLMPVEVFSPKSAPANTKFAVFVRGERLLHENRRNVVKIRTDYRRRLLSDNGYEYRWDGREFPLPEDAVLVPTSRVGQAGKHVARSVSAAPA